MFSTYKLHILYFRMFEISTYCPKSNGHRILPSTRFPMVYTAKKDSFADNSNRKYVFLLNSAYYFYLI